MNIGVVIVTYNRIDQLKKSLKKYTKQTFLPKRIVVVNNCSTDGTGDYLEKWVESQEGPDKKVLSLPRNIGGSGGFYEGLKETLTQEDIDWIWVADDDAFPVLTAFENAKRFIEEHKKSIDEISAVCGVCGYDGHYSDRQRFFLKKTIFGIQDLPVSGKEYLKHNEFDIGMYSFVGTLMKRSALIDAGLPRKDFFIYQDDLEHAVRIRKTGRIVCTNSIKIMHRDNTDSFGDASWRDYYATRNIVALYLQHFDRWSLFWRIQRRRLVSCLSFNRMKLKLVNAGIKDGINGNMGIHPVYKPGWKGQ